MTPSRTRSTKLTGLASLACTTCRKQHLKCDAKRPVCSRCHQNGHTCLYQPSRRGGRRKPHLTQSENDSRSQTASCSSVSRPLTSPGSVSMSASASISGASIRDQPPPPPPTVVSSGLPNSDLGTGTPASDGNSLSYFSNASPGHLLWPTIFRNTYESPQARPVSSSSSDSDRFLRLFYENFHTAHPILVPGSKYSSRNYPHFLRLVVDFAGCHYVQTSPCEELKGKVSTELNSNPDRSACMVQAWLIYSIVLFSRGDLNEAQNAFSRCTEIAFELGMNRAAFASSQHPETSIEAESLRRTWWELFIADVLLSIPLRTISFRCSAVSPEVPLPCEESLYTGDREIPQPRRMLDFKRRVLSEEDIVFSSFSYRIEAATILGRVLVLNRLKDYHRDHVQAIENALVSWSNHLPADKLDIVNSYGNMDEIMFQAHAIIAYASMLLHLPRSRFYPLLSSTEDPFLPFTQLHSSSASTRLIQSIKATDASRRISDYMSLCPNIQKHTPFIIPALVVCGLIQLATSINHSEECFDHHYNRITLVLGCLKNMKRTWRLAEPAYHRVRSTAAALISESMDRWNAEPLSRSIALTQSTPAESGRSSSLATETIAQGQEMTVPELDPSFIDPICYSSSLFSSLPDFEFT